MDRRGRLEAKPRTSSVLSFGESPGADAMSPYRRAREVDPAPRPSARTRRAIFIAIVPLWLVALDPLWPVFSYYTGGCMSYRWTTATLLHLVGGFPLPIAAVPVMVSEILFAGLLTASVMRRLGVRFYRPRGPILGARSRRAATVGVMGALASLPIFGCVLVYAGRDDPNPALFRGLGCLALGMGLVGGALVASARGARGYRRWALLLAAHTASATPRTMFTWVVPRMLEVRFERRERLQGAAWSREWGSDLNLAVLAALVVLSVVAAWPSVRTGAGAGPL